MKRKKNGNYLDLVPVISEKITWEEDEKGIVTLCVENKGLMKRLTQVILFKPKMTYIHLDREGSLVWHQINGERDISAIATEIKANEELDGDYFYERLAKYFSILYSYGFVKYK